MMQIRAASITSQPDDLNTIGIGDSGLQTDGELSRIANLGRLYNLQCNSIPMNRDLPTDEKMQASQHQTNTNSIYA